MSATAISIVVRTLDAADTLGRVLGALDRGPDDELLVVDSGSTDGTLDIARRHGGRVVPIRREAFTYGRALNLGFAAARHPWILSISSHTIPTEPGLLDKYRRAVAKFPPAVTAAVGPVVGEFDAALTGGITYFEGDDLRRGFGFGAGNPNCLYRRAAWERRTFDEQIGGGEDLQWYIDALRAGETVAAIHAARVLYASRRPMAAFYRKGRVDYRAADRLIEPHRPTFAGLLIRAAKLALYVPMGRMDWHSARGSMAHCLGSYVESRALARKSRG